MLKIINLYKFNNISGIVKLVCNRNRLSNNNFHNKFNNINNLNNNNFKFFHLHSSFLSVKKTEENVSKKRKKKSESDEDNSNKKYVFEISNLLMGIKY